MPSLETWTRMDSSSFCDKVHHDLAVNASIEPGECQDLITIIAILRWNTTRPISLTLRRNNRVSQDRFLKQISLLFLATWSHLYIRWLSKLAARVGKSLHALPPTDWILPTDRKNFDNRQDEFIKADRLGFILLWKNVAGLNDWLHIIFGRYSYFDTRYPK